MKSNIAENAFVMKGTGKFYLILLLSFWSYFIFCNLLCNFSYELIMSFTVYPKQTLTFIQGNHETIYLKSEHDLQLVKTNIVWDNCQNYNPFTHLLAKKKGIGQINKNIFGHFSIQTSQ